jgi:hypothetical protein
MTSTKKNDSALTSLGRAVHKEWNDSVARVEKNVRADADSIAKAIEKGGFLGGGLQAVDVFSPGHQTANLLESFRVIGADPTLKEGISLGVNAMTGSHVAALKDLADLVGTMSFAKAPSASPAAPALSAPAPSAAAASGHGYPKCAGGHRNVVENQRACLTQVAELQRHLGDIREQYVQWKKANPNAPEPTDGEKPIGDIVNGDMPVHEQCVRLLCVILMQHPEILDEAGVPDDESFRAHIPSHEIPGQAPGGAAPAGGDFLTMMGQMFGPLAQLLGGLLQSPLAIPLLAAAANLIPPPVGQIVAVAVPFLAPIAGQALQAVGGMAAGQGAAPGAPGAAPDLGALVGGLTGLLGGIGGLAGTPAPVPAA